MAPENEYKNKNLKIKENFIVGNYHRNISQTRLPNIP